MTGNNPILGGGGLHHFAVRTPDFEDSCAFYTGVLGFTKAVQFERGGKRFAWLDAGRGDYLEVVEADEPITPGTDTDVLWHLCLRTTNIRQVIAAVEAAGCEVTVPVKEVDLENTADDPPSPLPVSIAFFRGPSGELVELIELADEDGQPNGNDLIS